MIDMRGDEDSGGRRRGFRRQETRIQAAGSSSQEAGGLVWDPRVAAIVNGKILYYYKPRQLTPDSRS
jgi:hypothetical protein